MTHPIYDSYKITCAPFWRIPDTGILDHSTLKCASTCLRKCFYRYGLGLTQKDEHPALSFGTAIHLGTANIRLNKSISEAFEAFSSEWVDRPDQPNRTSEVAHELLSQYSIWWKGSGFTLCDGPEPGTYAQELGFCHTYGADYSPPHVKGRIDAIVEHRATDKHYLLDDKTTSISSNTWWEAWAMDSQLHCYTTAARGLAPTDGFMIIALKVSASILPLSGRRRKGNEQGIHNMIYNIRDVSLDAHKREFIYWYQTLNNIIKETQHLPAAAAEWRFPRSQEACVNRYHTLCPYLDACKYGIEKSNLDLTCKCEPWTSWEPVVAAGEDAC